jgi:hypothetical protein
VKLALILLVPILLFSAWNYTRGAENENRLALVASEVVLQDVDVSCPGFFARLVEITPYGGWVESDAHGRPELKTSLSAKTCSSLAKLWRADEPPSFACLLDAGQCSRDTLDIVGALVVLAHESWHMRGITGEAQTQCYAVQTVEFVARRFGIPAQDARTIAVYVALEDAASGLGEYHSVECRPGGAYDLAPATARWPD